MIEILLKKCELCDSKNHCNIYEEINTFLKNTKISNSDFNKHLIGATKTAIKVSDRLLEIKLLKKDQSCLSVFGTLIHDLGYYQDMFHCPQYLRKETRHSYFLEFFLRIKCCDNLAQTIRHSAPQINYDVLSGNISLPQLICAFADATTDSNGNNVSLLERDTYIRKKKGNNKDWDDLAQDRFINLLKQFNVWLQNPYSSFGAFSIKKSDIKVTFIERFDDKYSLPDSAYCSSNSIYHITKTNIAKKWCTKVLPTLSSLNKDYSFKKLVNDFEQYEIVVTSWIALIEELFIHNKCIRVLLFRGFNLKNFNSRISKLRELSANGKVDLIIVVSVALQKALETHGIFSVVVPNGIDESFQPINTFIKNDYVLYVGAPIKEKGIEVINEAAFLLNQIGVKTIVIGNSTIYGNHRKNNETYNNVECLDFIENNKLPKFYSKALVTIIPTHPEYFIEGFSKVALESLRMGTPLIVSDCGNLPNWIIENKTGWVMKEYNHLELYRLVKENLINLQKSKFYDTCVSFTLDYHWEYTTWLLEQLLVTLKLKIQYQERPTESEVIKKFDNFIHNNFPELSRLNFDFNFFNRPHNNKNDNFIIVFEPHPDDISYSCALHLFDLQTKGYNIIIVTCFSNTDVAFFRYAGAFTISQEKYNLLRNEENKRVLADLLGFEVIQLNYSSATLRGKGNILQYEMEQAIEESLENEFKSILDKFNPIRVYAPLAIQSHLDHVLVRNVLLNLIPNDQLLFYEDSIYNELGFEIINKYLDWNSSLIEFESVSANENNLIRKMIILSHFLTQIPVTDFSSLKKYTLGLFNKNSAKKCERIWKISK